MKTYSEELLNDPTSDMDDFQQITGIGPAIADALSGIGITRLEDLVAYTSEDQVPNLVELLKSDVKNISEERIFQDDWHGQAKTIIQRKNKKKISEPILSESLNTELSSQVHLNEKPSTEEKEDNWHELADFFVSFGEEIGSNGEARIKTKIHHSQGDKDEHWYGIAVDQLTKWMMDEANLSPLILEDEVSEDIPLAESLPPNNSGGDINISLTNLWVSQVEMQTNINGKVQPGVMRVNSSFNVFGSDAVNLTYERIPYIIEAYLVNTESKQSELVATQKGQLTPEDLNYDIQQEFPVPPHGRYQLYVLGRLLLPSIDAVNFQGPIIRVES